MPEIGDVTVIPKGKEYHVEWKMNFDSDSEEDNLQKIYSSPEFYFENEYLTMMILPNRSKSMNAGYISLMIFGLGYKGSPKKVLLISSLKNVHGKKYFKKQITKVFNGDSFHTFDRFLSISEIKKRQSEFLSSGFLTIVCTLKRLSFPESASGANASGSSVVHHHNKVMQDFKELFLKQESCDVVLRVKGQEFHVHKAILIARSPVFASTFRHDMKEKESGIIAIEDCDPSVFPDFLCFLYSGDMNNLSSENVFSLFIAADKYDVSDLRIKCVEFMKVNISVETFCEITSLAFQHTETELIHLAIDFFMVNAEQILETMEWQSFVAENLTHSNQFIKFVKDRGTFSSESVFGLFTAADKYGISDLRTKSVEFMKENLSVETFCETFSLALQHTETELINLATEFFTRNAQQILETVEWNSFVNKFPTHSIEFL